MRLLVRVRMRLLVRVQIVIRQRKKHYPKIKWYSIWVWIATETPMKTEVKRLSSTMLAVLIFLTMLWWWRKVCIIHSVTQLCAWTFLSILIAMNSKNSTWRNNSFHFILHIDMKNDTYFLAHFSYEQKHALLSIIVLNFRYCVYYMIGFLLFHSIQQTQKENGRQISYSMIKMRLISLLKGRALSLFQQIETTRGKRSITGVAFYQKANQKTVKAWKCSNLPEIWNSSWPRLLHCPTRLVQQSADYARLKGYDHRNKSPSSVAQYRVWSYTKNFTFRSEKSRFSGQIQLFLFSKIWCKVIIFFEKRIELKMFHRF